MTGRIETIPNGLVIQWKIDNFLSYSDRDYYSHHFTFENHEWSLIIHPNGHKTDGTAGNIDLCLRRWSPNVPKCMDFSFAFKTVNGMKYQEKHWIGTVFKGFRHDFYCRPFISRFEILRRASELLEFGSVLTVVCTLKNPESASSAKDNSEKSSKEVATQTKKENASEKLSDDLKEMMLTGDYSDTTIKVKEEGFRLHKNILAARNPFFHALFKNDMKEKATGVVSIEDCEPDIFRSFIHFVYTGKVDQLSPENVCGLYEIAEKYQEDQLKKDCFNFIVNTISTDNFCDYAVLAISHGEEKLLQVTTKFFAKNIKEIIRSVKWQNFLLKYTIQANELHIKALDYSDDK